MRYNTRIKFAIITNEYVSGSGAISKTTMITASITPGVITEDFHCNWTTNYGSLGIEQHSQNILEGARVRMKYVKQIVDAMRSTDQLFIYKDGIKNEAHTFILNSSVDDIKEAHKELEFQVKRWVHK